TQKPQVRPQASASPALAASTSGSTVRPKAASRRRGRARAWRWDSKKRIAARSEPDGDRRALGVAGGGLGHAWRGEAAPARHHQRRELLGRVVEFEHLVVEGLAREADAVFGAGKLFAEFAHALVGLEIGVVLDHRHETAERTTEQLLGPRERAHQRRRERP